MHEMVRDHAGTLLSIWPGAQNYQIFIVTLIVGVCYCSMFCCTLLYVHSSIAIILMGKRELVASLSLSSWCLVMVERLFLAVPRGCLRFVIVVFPDHTHLLFLTVIVSLVANFRGLASFLPNLYRNQATLHYRRYVCKKMLLGGYLLRAIS